MAIHGQSVLAFIIGIFAGSFLVLAIPSQPPTITDTATNTMDPNTNTADHERDNIIANILNNTLTAAPIHNPQAKLDVLCNKYSNICDKIQYQINLTTQQKRSYTALIVFTTSKIQRYLKPQLDTSLLQQLQHITITNTPGKRGHAHRQQITLNLANIGNHKEFIEIYTHELGHIIDLNLLTGRSLRKHPTFTEFGQQVIALDDPSLSFYQLSRKGEKQKKADTNKYDFPSGYGASSTFEDLAESFNLYMHHNALFRYYASISRIMANKYAFWAHYTNGQFLFDNPQDLDQLPNQQHKLFFDTTRIAQGNQST